MAPELHCINLQNINIILKALPHGNRVNANAIQYQLYLLLLTETMDGGVAGTSAGSGTLAASISIT